MLIPLKPGNHLLPNVEIRAKLKPKDDAKSQGGVGNTELQALNCETDYLSYGESVMVVPDVSSSTVGIGDMSVGAARNVVWLERSGL